MFWLLSSSFHGSDTACCPLPWPTASVERFRALGRAEGDFALPILQSRGRLRFYSRTGGNVSRVQLNGAHLRTQHHAAVCFRLWCASGCNPVIRLHALYLSLQTSRALVLSAAFTLLLHFNFAQATCT